MRCSLVLFSFCLIAGVAAEIPAAADDVQPIADVRSLPFAEVAKEPEVRVRGVVTQRVDDTAVVDDGTAGIFVNLFGASLRGLTPLEHLPGDLQPGTAVEIEGVLIVGGYAPVILPREIRVAGPAAFPPIRRTAAVRFFSGTEDCQLVEFEGIVQGVRKKDGVAELSLSHEGRLFLARIDKGAFPGEVSSLVDAVVRLGGVGMSRFNARGEFLMPSILVTNHGHLEVVCPPPYEPFDGPTIPLADLAGFSAVPRDGHRVRIEGTVVQAAAGEVYVQDGAIGVRVETDAPVECVAGDCVEAAGFIDRRQRVAGLAHAVIRRLAAGGAPSPITISPDEIVAANRFGKGSYTRPVPGDYEQCLVTFPARLVEKQVTHGGGSLLVAAGKTTVIAQLSAAEYARLAKLEPGADVSLTGIVRTIWEPTKSFPSAPIEVLDRMTLLVRSADDVILSDPRRRVGRRRGGRDRVGGAPAAAGDAARAADRGADPSPPRCRCGVCGHAAGTQPPRGESPRHGAPNGDRHRLPGGGLQGRRRSAVGGRGPAFRARGTDGRACRAAAAGHRLGAQGGGPLRPALSCCARRSRRPARRGTRCGHRRGRRPQDARDR